MSASRNADAMNPSQGEFSSRVPPSEPLTRKGHAPGVKVGNDAVPEFHAQTHPAGSTPLGQTFTPNASSEVPGQALNSDIESGTRASDTLIGATSADVHTGYGHPGEGMTSQELHGGKGKRVGAGIEGVGGTPADPIHEQGHDRDYETGHRGKSGNAENWPAAEDRIPTSAEEVASERR